MTFIIIISAITSFTLSILVIVKSRKSCNVFFSIFAFVTAWWILTNYLISIFPTIFLLRNSYAAGVLVAPCALAFVLVFIQEKIEPKKILPLYISSIILFLLTYFNGLIIKKADSIFLGGFSGEFGPLFPIFSIYSILLVLFTLSKLFIETKKAQGIKRLQLQYFSLGMFLFGSIASLCSFILPLLGINRLIPLDSPTSLFFIIFTAYAITRYRLMDIRLVIKRSVTYLLLIISIAAAYLVVAYAIIAPLTNLLGISRQIFFAVWGLVIVFAFQPIKKYIDRATDRVFFKGTRDYNAILSELSQNMSLVVDLGKVVEIACKTIEEKLYIKETFFLIHITDHVDRYLVSRLAKDLRQKRIHGEKGTGEYVTVDSPLPKFFSKNSEIIILDELKQKISNEEFTGSAKQLKEVLSELIRLNAQIAVPLKARGGLVGVFLLTEKKSGEVYTKGDIDFFQLLSSQLATAIERSRLYDRLEININELVTLQGLSKIINSSLDIRHTLNAVMDAVIKVAGVDRALLYLLDRSGKELVATVGRGDKEELYRGLVIDLSKSSLGYVVKNKKPLIVEDVNQDKRVNPDYARAVKTKGFIAVPLMTKDKVLGVIGVDNLHSDRPLSGVNVELLMTLASQAAIAIDNTRLYQEVKDFNTGLKKKVDNATKRLRELLKIKSEFLTVASHQLRTPTSIVRGMLSLVMEEEGLSHEERERFISQAYQGINRLERIIHDLLNATELEGRKMKLELKPVAMDSIINEIILELSHLAKDREVILEYTRSKTLPPKIMADGLKLREAIQNIIDNAIQYTPQGKVTVLLEHDPRNVKIIIKDNGIGMSKKDISKLFKKFTRGQGVLQVQPNGSGLGLFIAKKIIEGMDGEIKAESEGKNKGSTFSITLPVPKKSELLK